MVDGEGGVAGVVEMSEPRYCESCLWWSWMRTAAVFEAGHRRCLNKKLQSNLYASDSLAPQDLHELDAITTTGPKFGCIHWEEK